MVYISNFCLSNISLLLLYISNPLFSKTDDDMFKEIVHIFKLILFPFFSILMEKKHKYILFH